MKVTGNLSLYTNEYVGFKHFSNVMTYSVTALYGHLFDVVMVGKYLISTGDVYNLCKSSVFFILIS